MRKIQLLVIALVLSSSCYGQFDTVFFRKWLPVEISGSDSIFLFNEIDKILNHRPWYYEPTDIKLPDSDQQLSFYLRAAKFPKPIPVFLSIDPDTVSTGAFDLSYFHDSVFVEVPNTKKSMCIFSDCGFENSIVFRGGVFGIPGDLLNCVNFADCSFARDVKFFKTTFKGDLNFLECHLGGTLFFGGTSFEGSILFLNTPLPDSLVFNYVKISNEIDLTNAYLDEDQEYCSLFLIGVDISKIKLQYREFKLFFPKGESDDIISGTYENLLANFKKNGFTDSYTLLDIEYHDWQQKTNRLLWLSDWWWTYGYEKSKILFHSIQLILIFTLINLICYKQLQAVYPIRRLSWSEVPWHSNLVVRTVRRFVAAFLYTGIIFFRFNIDLKNMMFFPSRYSILIIFEYVIGLICTGFIINWILG
jgi:hypothetical protein